MIFSLLRFYYRLKPSFLGFWFKLLFTHKGLRIGKNFKRDTFPKMLIDKGSKVEIGSDVIFRRNVEIRSHGNSTIKIGDNCRIDRGVRLLSANQSALTLESGVRIGLYSVFNGGDSIIVGAKTLISGFVYLQTSMHNYKGNNAIQEQGYSHSPIVIGEDNWLGTHVVVFPGVTLSEKCVVGSNSVLNKSFGPNSIVAGSPAALLTKKS